MASSITRVSTTSDGQQADGASNLDTSYSTDAGALGPNAFSSDGSEIVFVTSAEDITGGASDLVLKNLNTGQDTIAAAADNGSFTPDGKSLVYTAFDNGGEQIYEQTGGKTVLVSSAADGTEGNADSGVMAVSITGSRVAFESSSTNLVSGQTAVESYVKDIATNNIVQLGDGSTSTTDSEEFSYAPDLSEAVYTNEPTDEAGGPAPEVYVENLTTGAKTLVSGIGGTAGDKGGYGGVLVSGGSVAFNTSSTNLVSGAPSGGIFLQSPSGALSAVLTNNITTSGNVTSGTAYQIGAASADGTQLAYYSATGSVTKASDGSDQGSFTSQIFARNLSTGADVAVSPSAMYTFSDGPPIEAGSPYESPFGDGGLSETGSINGTIYAEPVYSPDGSQIAYVQETYNNFSHDNTGTTAKETGTETSQVFVYNVATGGPATAVTDPVTYDFATGSGGYYTDFAFSPNSQDIEVDQYTVSPSTQGSTTSTTTSQTIVTDLATGSRTTVPVDSSDMLFAPDGNSVAFASTDSTLVPNDTNDASDVFIQTLQQCFVTGTAIRTARGDVPVEALCVDDEALTSSGVLRPIVWIGRRAVDCRALAIPSDSWPVRVRAGAFGGDLPERELLLSPGHPVLVGEGRDELLVPIMCLINGTSIDRVPVDTVTYWHVELDVHDILLAEGLPAESFLDLGSRGWFETGVQDRLASPDLVPRGANGRCRPVAIDGPAVEAERRRLDAVFAIRLEAPCDWPTDELSVAWN